MDKKTVTKVLGLSDAIIQRADNGWILTTVDWLDDGGDGECIERTAVFEDADVASVYNQTSESLSNLLWVAFDDHMQSKHGAGLVIAAKQSKTREEKNEAVSVTSQATGIVGEGYNNKNIKNEMEQL
jgi:hypothetical protein